MSFNESITKAIDNVVYKYIQEISTKYKLDKNQLINIWTGKQSHNNLDEIADSKTESKVDSELSKCGKTELMALCKAKGLSHTGTKQVLIERLLEKDSKKVEAKQQPKKAEPISIGKKIQNSISTVQIRRNKFGNYEHPDTMFVFDKVGQQVIGKQNSSGRIDTLTKEDIEECKRYKFKYTIPDNLDKKTKLEDVKIDDLEEEEEVSVDEDNEDEPKEEEIIVDEDSEEEEELEDDEEFDDDCDEEDCYESD